jgi:hypothetical protein
MPARSKQPRRLSDADLQQLLELTKGADSVELKLTVPDSERRSTVMALGMDALDAQIRLRPVVPGELPAGLRSSKNLVVEVDAMPGGYVCSASFKGTLGTTDVQQVAVGKRAIRKLFSKEQRAFVTAHAPGGLGLDDLTMLGPINLMKLKFSPAAYRRRLVAELWMYPDGSRILELSTKCAPAEGFQVAAETRAFLAEQGVELSGEQQTKTKAALEYFSKNLTAAATS